MKNCKLHKQDSRAGKLIAAALAFFLFCSVTSQAQGVKIHQLGLGDGDCALIEVIDHSPLSTPTNPILDTAVILIDAQRNKTYASWEISDFIEKRLGDSGLKRKVIDYVVLSHVHIDHYGNMVNALSDLVNEGYRISNVFDRLAINVSYISWTLDSLDECYDELSTGKLSASAAKYNQYIRSNFGSGYYAILPGQDMFQNRFKNSRMLCVAGFGATVDSTSGNPQFFIPYNGSYYIPKSENDLSFAFLLSYGGFRYFTGGDLGGQDHSGYANGEVPVAKYLRSKSGANFHFCAFKVSHHGSSESSAPAFLNLVKPTLGIIPASLRHYGSSVKPLPTCETLDNLIPVVKKLAFTFVPNGNLSVPANYCKYRNLKNTQDVSIVVNYNDVTDSITMHLYYQERNSNYDPVGTPTTENVVCTKVHTTTPFSPTMSFGVNRFIDLVDGNSNEPQIQSRTAPQKKPVKKATAPIRKTIVKPVKKQPAKTSSLHAGHAHQ